jgi:hypothetical protein
MENKEAILTLLNSVKRRGMDSLIDYIENKTDYFTAPASVRYHGCYQGGLAEHHLDVYNCFKQLQETPQFKQHNFPEESVILISLLHDMCKTNFYFETTRNVRNEVTGQWEKVPYYEVIDSHPYGHGECSVMLVSDYIRLTTEEKYAIRWHSGGFDKSCIGGLTGMITDCFKNSPICVCAHLADMMATYTCNREKK